MPKARTDADAGRQAREARPSLDAGRHYEEVLRLAAAHPDLPLEAVFKEDLLRLGMHFTPAALERAAAHKPKAYFIFSFDMVPLAELPEAAAAHAPEEIAFLGGPHHFRRTIVSVRLNPRSPYRIDAGETGLELRLGPRALSEVKLAPFPEYYRHPLPSGKLLREIAPTIEWGYLVYLTVFRLCQYFGSEEECQFCDINENFRQQRNAGRPYHQVKEPADVVAGLEIIDACEQAMASAPAPDLLPLHRTTAYTLTGGSITTQLQGLGEIDFYCRYVEAIERRFPRRWISKMVVQAHEPDAVRRMRDAGVQIYHPNYEVWDPRLFALLCPGKARAIGRDTWVRRILNAAEILGPAQVIPNFVAGVEMARPHGFTEIEAALGSTGEGLEFFMSQGIVPRFTTWCPEPLSLLGRDQGPAPLAYHVGLLQLWRDTHRRHGLAAPPGYGEPGAGRAVFSVSAFMDVLESHPETPGSRSKAPAGT